MNKNQRKKNKMIPYEEEDEERIEVNSCSSFSEGEKDNRNLPIVNIKCNLDNIKPNNRIKKEQIENIPCCILNNKTQENCYNDYYSLDKIDIVENINNNYSPSDKKRINKNNIYSPNKDNNTVLKNLSIKEVEYGSSIYDSFNYSFPIEYEEKLQIKEDLSYFSKNSRYIKYHPIDQFLPTQDETKKKRRIIKKLKFPKKENMIIDSENEITDITSCNNENDSEILPILTIPRIKPIREEHIKAIKEKLEHDGIKIYQTDNDTLKKEEHDLYAGSFILFDLKNDARVYVPCYKDNEKMNEFMKKRKLGVIEFQEDNDIDTDDEQLQLEIERNNEALINFIKKIEKEKDYIEKNLQRK